MKQTHLMKQAPLFKLKDFSTEFGGSLLKDQRKRARPLSSKNALKVVLRGDIRNSGSLLKYKRQIGYAFDIFQKQFQVKVYRYAIVSNHLHFLALFPSRDQYRKFIRALTGTIARQTKIKWIFRPWSRIVAWGKAFKIAANYVVQNSLEAIGAIPYQARKKKPPPD